MGKGEGEKKLVRCEILAYHEKFVFPSKKKIGVRKVLATV